MKLLSMLLFAAIPAICFGQKKPTPTKVKSTQPKQVAFELPKIKAPIIYIPPRMRHQYSSDSATIYLSDSVKVKNGKDEQVMVYFTASVAVNSWNKLVDGRDEKDYFSLVGAMLSLKAQYVLKNTLSFEPFKNEFFTWSEERKAFICNYKMMGRNGYSNLLETSTLVEYDPVLDR